MPHRKIYKKHYGPIPKEPNGRSYEIHHIDGNHQNNDPLNLVAVTIQEHYDIHYSQGDYGACLLISAHMNITPEEKSRLASLANARRVEDGRHNFLGPETNAKRVDDGTHPFLGDKNPSHKRVKDGTHPFLGGEIQRETQKRRAKDGSHNFLGGEIQKRMIDDGTHPFLGGEIQRETQKRRAKDGSHNFLGPITKDHTSQVEWTCPHCHKSGKGEGNYNRWHGNNCRQKITCI